MEEWEIPQTSRKYARNLLKLCGCKGQYLCLGKGKDLYAYRRSIPQVWFPADRRKSEGRGDRTLPQDFGRNDGFWGSVLSQKSVWLFIGLLWEKSCYFAGWVRHTAPGSLVVWLLVWNGGIHERPVQFYIQDESLSGAGGYDRNHKGK